MGISFGEIGMMKLATSAITMALAAMATGCMRDNAIRTYDRCQLEHKNDIELCMKVNDWIRDYACHCWVPRDSIRSWIYDFEGGRKEEVDTDSASRHKILSGADIKVNNVK